MGRSVLLTPVLPGTSPPCRSAAVGALSSQAAPARVLDFGTGPGVFSAIASTDAAFVVSIDLVPGMLIAGKLTSRVQEVLSHSVGCQPNQTKILRAAGSDRPFEPTPSSTLSSQSQFSNTVRIRRQRSPPWRGVSRLVDRSSLPSRSRRRWSAVSSDGPIPCSRGCPALIVRPSASDVRICRHGPTVMLLRLGQRVGRQD